MPDFRDLDAYDDRPVNRPLTVAGLLKGVKSEFQRAWNGLIVEGEIHSIKAYPSGHVYFDLKDAREDALLSCVLFRRDAQQLKFSPKVGDLVQIAGGLNVYEPRGQMNFIARSMVPAGSGALYARFLELKDKLASEGLFAAERKRKLPAYPTTVGIVTSPEAAALRDVLRTLKNLAPWVSVILYPASVQGAQAEGELITALKTCEMRREVDVVLVVRGGGSLVDLWSFNLESVARMIAAISIPVISGVGHETDFTIADFVSDVRAATPTAAAALAVDGWTKAAALLGELDRRMDKSIRMMTQSLGQRLEKADRMDFAIASLVEHARLRFAAVADIRRIVENRIDVGSQRVDYAQMRLTETMDKRLERVRSHLSQVEIKLQAPDTQQKKLTVDSLDKTLDRLLAGDVALKREKLKGLKKRLQGADVAGVLKRGFSLVVDESGKLVKDAQNLRIGQSIEVRFVDGQAKSTVQSISKDDTNRK